MKRSSELELLDLGSTYYTEDEYRECLKQLARVGRLLGGDRATLNTLHSFKKPQTILDVGCGGGYFTIKLAKEFPQAFVVGMDIAAQAIEFAKKQLDEEQIKNIRFDLSASPELSYLSNSFDLVTATLVCHHMNGNQLVDFLKKAYAVASEFIVINDLHRHWLAYLSFAAIAPPLFANRLITHDGLISIKRSFKKNDWIQYLTAAKIPLSQCKISWHWPFRWIITIEKL